MKPTVMPLASALASLATAACASADERRALEIQPGDTAGSVADHMHTDNVHMH